MKRDDVKREDVKRDDVERDDVERDDVERDDVERDDVERDDVEREVSSCDLTFHVSVVRSVISAPICVRFLSLKVPQSGLDTDLQSPVPSYPIPASTYWPPSMRNVLPVVKLLASAAR